MTRKKTFHFHEEDDASGDQLPEKKKMTRDEYEDMAKDDGFDKDHWIEPVTPAKEQEEKLSDKIEADDMVAGTSASTPTATGDKGMMLGIS